MGIADDLAGAIREHGSDELAVSVRHGERAGRLDRTAIPSTAC